jgi:tetratricopeptide (TPR) repeat protein
MSEIGTERSRTIISLIVVMMAGWAAYANSFSVPFQFDDFGNITSSPKTLDIHNPQVIWQHYTPTRFVTYFSLAMNYHLGRENVFGYHVFNFAIHLANAILVFILLRLLIAAGNQSGPETLLRRHPALLSSPWLLALSASLIFVTHPIQTQAVTYIVQRAASLAAFFYLASMALYLKGRLRSIARMPLAPVWGVAALCTTVLAMLTKEISFTLPMTLLLIEIFFFAPISSRKSQLLWLFPFLLCLSIIPGVLWMRSSNILLDDIGQLAAENPNISRYQYLLTQFHVICTYLRLLFVPLGQNLDYDYPIYARFWHTSTVLCCVVLLTILLWGIWLFRRSRMLSFAVFFFFLTLSVESSVIPISDLIFEHRLYLPCFAFAIVMTFVLVSCTSCRYVFKFLPCQHFFVALFLLYSIALGITTYQRNKVWQTPLGLWQDTVSKSPCKARAYNNLGTAYYSLREYEKAISSYRQAISLYPRYGRAYNNLGISYQRLKKYEEAIVAHQQALTYWPNYVYAVVNLALAYQHLGKFEESIGLLKRALQMQPDSAAACYHLAGVYTQLEQYALAIQYYRKANVYGYLPDAYFQLGNIYWRIGQIKEAIDAYQNAIYYNPKMISAHYNLGMVYSLRNLWSEAIQQWKHVLLLDPAHQEALLRLEEAAKMGMKE